MQTMLGGSCKAAMCGPSSSPTLTLVIQGIQSGMRSRSSHSANASSSGTSQSIWALQQQRGGTWLQPTQPAYLDGVAATWLAACQQVGC